MGGSVLHRITLQHRQLQTTTNHYAATAMTQNLAEQLTTKLKARGVEATVCYLFADLDTIIYDTLVDIGEEAPRQSHHQLHSPDWHMPSKIAFDDAAIGAMQYHGVR